MDYINKAISAGLLRHLLTFAGGGLVSSGVITSGDMETGVGAIVALIGIVWSIMVKKKAA